MMMSKYSQFSRAPGGRFPWEAYELGRQAARVLSCENMDFQMADIANALTSVQVETLSTALPPSPIQIAIRKACNLEF